MGHHKEQTTSWAHLVCHGRLFTLSWLCERRKRSTTACCSRYLNCPEQLRRSTILSKADVIR